MRELWITVGNLESRRNRIPERWMLRDDRSALGRMRSPLAAGRMRIATTAIVYHTAARGRNAPRILRRYRLRVVIYECCGASSVLQEGGTVKTEKTKEGAILCNDKPISLTFNKWVQCTPFPNAVWAAKQR